MVGKLERSGGASGGGRCRQNVSQIHLALIVVCPQGSQGCAQEVRVESIDTGVDLVDGGLLGRRVTLLNDGSDRAGVIADNAPGSSTREVRTVTA